MVHHITWNGGKVNHDNRDSECFDNGIFDDIAVIGGIDMAEWHAKSYHRERWFFVEYSKFF